MVTRKKDSLDWYGYILVNGGEPHVRRYLDHTGDGDIAEAKESPFVDAVYGPFKATSKHMALQVLYKLHIVDGNRCRICQNKIEEGHAGKLCLECDGK